MSNPDKEIDTLKGMLDVESYHYLISTPVDTNQAFQDSQPAFIADENSATLEVRVSEIAKLKWSEPEPPNQDSSYDHVMAETPFGQFKIEWKSWKDYPGFTIDNPLFLNTSEWIRPKEDTLESAKQAVNDYIIEKVNLIINGCQK